MNLLTKQKQTHRLENELMVMGGKLGEGIAGEVGMDRNKVLYLKWITNKNLTV